MARIFYALAVGAIVASSPAAACDCIGLDTNGPQFAANLDRIAKFYPVAAEGVIERDGRFAWRFRPTREYRGAGKSFYRIEQVSDCSLDSEALTRLIGKPVFLLLAGGPDRFEAGRCVNLLGSDIDAAIRRRVMSSCPPR